MNDRYIIKHKMGKVSDRAVLNNYCVALCWVNTACLWRPCSSLYFCWRITYPVLN
jgi:hypothetical protein